MNRGVCMLFSIAMILDRISQLGKIFPDNGIYSDEIHSVKIFTDDVGPLDEDIVYVIPFDVFQTRPACRQCRYAFVLLTWDQGDPIPEIPDGWFLLSSPLTPDQVLFALRDAFMYYDQYYVQIIRAIARGDSLHVMTDLVSRCTSCPVMIFDTDLKLLSYSKTITLAGDKVWDTTVESGYPDMAGNNAIADKLYHDQIIYKNNAFIFESKFLVYRFVSKNITLKSEMIGILNAVEVDRPITQGTIDTIELFAPLFSIELSRNRNQYANVGINHSQIFFDLLENRIPTTNVFESRIKNINWKQAVEFTILYVIPVHDFLNDAHLNALCIKLKRTLNISKGVVYANGLVMMLEKTANAPFPACYFNALTEFLVKENMVAGLSLNSRLPIETNILFSQAKDAVTFGQRASSIQSLYLFSDYVLDAFFAECTDKVKVSYYLHPSIRLLQRYDDSHNTSLVETLRVYLLNSSSQAETARDLDIHRSTLLYRINKIKEIAELNLADSETLFHLQLSFRLLNNLS